MKLWGRDYKHVFPQSFKKGVFALFAFLSAARKTKSTVLASGYI